MWYKIAITIPTTNDRGEQLGVLKKYLFESMTYTDAEASAYLFLEHQGIRDFNIKSITKMPVNDVFDFASDEEKWVKAKVNYIVFDERTQKEKKLPFHFMIPARDIKQAEVILTKNLGTVNDYEIAALLLTDIEDVIKAETPS